MKPTKLVIQIVGGLFLIIAIVVAIGFWRDSSKDVDEIEVAVQLAVDSLKEVHNQELIDREDSIQRVERNNIALLQTEKDKLQAKTRKDEQKLKEQSKTIAELEAQYAEQCGELIIEYRDREANALTIIKGKTATIAICEEQNFKLQSIVSSNKIKIDALVNTVAEKNKTITTLKDRNTTIENRMERSWFFRNWYWYNGKWRKYVLQ